LFTTEVGILEKVGGTYPGIYTSVTWVYKLDRSAVAAGDVEDIQQAIRETRFQIAAKLEHGSSTIRLNRVLDEYSEQLLLARIPLFLMVFLVAGILAYYLALVANLTIRSRHAEIAMLKSRGATTWQISLLVLVEGLLLAVPALIVGTLLAPVVGRILGGLFFTVSGPPVPVVLSSQAFLLGAAGAVLAVIVLWASTLVAARRGIVEYRQSGARPPQAPFIHRYYLDFVFLALIGLIWLQIQTRVDFLVRNASTGESTIDFTLLLGPILGLLALGLLVLRFFPVAVVLLAKLVEPVGPAWLVQGLRRVSRDPILPGCLVILLMLATALGVIGSAFSSTLDQSQRDRARYEAGADLRIEYTGDRHPLSSLGLSELAEGTPNVAVASEALRVSGYLLTRGFGSGRVSTLGVDTEKFARVAWYRPDFANDQPLEGLIEVISPDAVGNPPLLGPDDGLLLPRESTHLAVWAQLGRPSSRLSLAARLMDDAGRYFDVTLGSLERPDWQRLETELSPVISQGRPGTRTSIPEIQPPLTLLSLRITSTSGFNEPGVIFLDQIIAVGPSGERVVAGSQELTGWQVIEDFTTPGLNALEPSRSVTRNGNQESAAFSWAAAGVGIRSLRPGPPEAPIPAIVSPSILKEAGIETGETIPLALSSYGVPIMVVAVADYFPTLYPREQPFVVLDQASFIHYSNLHGPRIIGGPNELWGRLSGGAPDLTELAARLEGQGLRIRASHQSSLLIEERTEQPLTSSGWGGLLVLMFLALVLASSSGMVLFSYMDTRERQMEFALLRTLGSARRQVNGVVWFNLLLVVAAGIGLGTWAGQLIGITLLPILEVSEGGVRVTPPMVFQTDWRTLLISYLVLASVFAGTVLWLTWLTGKLEVQRVLRAGEAGA
ncbi:MAG: FtsX-like permease family protein, partial [Dehalococcoidia bacterium]